MKVTRYIEQFVNERNTLVYNKVLITIFRIFKENNKSCSKIADLSLVCYYYFVLFHLFVINFIYHLFYFVNSDVDSLCDLCL